MGSAGARWQTRSGSGEFSQPCTVGKFGNHGSLMSAYMCLLSPFSLFSSPGAGKDKSGGGVYGGEDLGVGEGPGGH